MQLSAFPSTKGFEISALVRLDLSYNNISMLPKEIGDMRSLRELWLHDNPLMHLSPIIAQCESLEVIDVRKTRVASLPDEICLLEKLYELDFSDTPLQPLLENEHSIHIGDIFGLKSLYRYRYDRKNLRATLKEKLESEHFARDADKPNFEQVVANVVEAAFNKFTDLAEFRLFVRRVDKLLPESVDNVRPDTIDKAKELFYSLRDDTTKHRLSADVEIKLRAIYFDRIERQMVSKIISSIYESVKSLEDIQFLVKYAPSLFPDKPDAATGALIWSNILDLQGQLTAKRNTAIASLLGAMTQLYPEQEPHLLKERAEEISKIYRKERFATKKELNSLSQVTAEASTIFPPDFLSATPEFVAASANAIFKRTTTAKPSTSASTKK